MASSWGTSWGTAWGNSWGNIGIPVTIFAGVSSVKGPTSHHGISRPTVQLTLVSAGRYDVEETHEVSGNQNPSTVSKETFLIDGDIP